MKQERYSNESKIFWEITASKFQRQHAAQFTLSRYEVLCPETNPPWVFSTEFREILEQLLSRIILRAASEKKTEKEKCA